jgi:hypothetical protein
MNPADSAIEQGLLEHIRELELRITTLEAVIAANYEIAELSLCIARAGIIVRPTECPAENPLNGWHLHAAPSET